MFARTGSVPWKAITMLWKVFTTYYFHGTIVNYRYIYDTFWGVTTVVDMDIPRKRTSSLVWTLTPSPNLFARWDCILLYTPKLKNDANIALTRTLLLFWGWRNSIKNSFFDQTCIWRSYVSQTNTIKAYTIVFLNGSLTFIGKKKSNKLPIVNVA